METVTLKSMIGPVILTSRPDPYTKNVYDWNFDNNFIVTVPKSWWGDHEEAYLDHRDGTRLRYNRAFHIISNQRRSYG